MLGRHQIPCRIAACVAFIATLLVGILAPPPAIAQQTSYVTWTEREYVYTPGYIDEFVAEYDAAGNHWPVLQDANFNAVALAHEDGRVARQRVLSPYGRVIHEDSGLVSGSPKPGSGIRGCLLSGWTRTRRRIRRRRAAPWYGTTVSGRCTPSMVGSFREIRMPQA